ncbi:hypothetical protein [Amycolatopsis pigmentata]|uniref:Uncharacterized protein n=1 Tax=Amycolatopsis pigmentata TaxID=450801 RepID=A0ABW5FLN5_9PSEU
MIVEQVARDRAASGWRLSATVRTEARPVGRMLHFILRGGEPDWLPERGDAFLAALLMPAMRLGEDLVLDAPVSPRLLRASKSVMEVYRAWGHGLVPVRVEARGRLLRDEPEGVGLFFTTGVDSFYSLFKDGELRADPGHRPITDLLYVNYERRAIRGYEMVLRRLRRVAGRTGCRTVVLDTNVRELADPLVPWEHYHGAALAAAALALQGRLRRCLIAASEDYSCLSPLGSHPALDPLWSTERLEIVHDGAEATRTDKVERMRSVARDARTRGSHDLAEAAEQAVRRAQLGMETGAW